MTAQIVAFGVPWELEGARSYRNRTLAGLSRRDQPMLLDRHLTAEPRASKSRMLNCVVFGRPYQICYDYRRSSRSIVRV